METEECCMIPVTLSTPENIWEISVPETSIDAIRKLAKTCGDKSVYCEVALPDEYHVNVPIEAVKYIDRLYGVGAFV